MAVWPSAARITPRRRAVLTRSRGVGQGIPEKGFPSIFPVDLKKYSKEKYDSQFFETKRITLKIILP